jgi:hypothetical protein
MEEGKLFVSDIFFTWSYYFHKCNITYFKYMVLYSTSNIIKWSIYTTCINHNRYRNFSITCIPFQTFDKSGIFYIFYFDVLVIYAISLPLLFFLSGMS